MISHSRGVRCGNVLLLPHTKHSGKNGHAESGLRAGAQLPSVIYADAERSAANGFTLGPTEMLKWKSRLAPLYLLRCGCFAEAVSHSPGNEDREEQRERLARVAGYGAGEFEYLLLIPPDSKRPLWNLQVRRV